jgi:hypothetical protein
MEEEIENWTEERDATAALLSAESAKWISQRYPASNSRALNRRVPARRPTSLSLSERLVALPPSRVLSGFPAMPLDVREGSAFPLSAH